MAKKLLSCWLMLGLVLSMMIISPIEVDAKGSRRTVSKRKGTVKRSGGRKRGKQISRSSRRRGSLRASSRRGRRARYSRISGPASAMPPERVREIQTALKREGFLEGEPNGTYDKATVDAMMRYQKARSMRATGYPTAEALNKLGLTKTRRVVSPNTTGETNVPTAPNESKESGPQPPVTSQEPGQNN